MTDIQDIFKRKDLKYVCSSEKANFLLKKWENFLTGDANMGVKEYYDVKSLYFDSPEYYFFNSHQENRLFRQKFRVRTYDDNGINDISYIEIKSKYKSMSVKRRIPLKLETAYNYLLKDIIPLDDKITENHIFKEIANLKKSNNLLPVVKIIYKRKAFFHKNISDIRITFDNNLFYNFYDFEIENDNPGKRLTKEDTYIIELKAMYGIPLEMAKAIDEACLFPQSFSKYIASMGKNITQKGADLENAGIDRPVSINF